MSRNAELGDGKSIPSRVKERESGFEGGGGGGGGGGGELGWEREECRWSNGA